MKYLIKVIESEDIVRGFKKWVLTFYDDVESQIWTITEFEKVVEDV